MSWQKCWQVPLLGFCDKTYESTPYIWLKLTENLLGMNDRDISCLVYKSAFGWFQCLGSTSDFLAFPLQLQNDCHRSRHHIHHSRMSKDRRWGDQGSKNELYSAVCLLHFFFFNQEENLPEPPSRCSLVSHWLEHSHLITPKQQGKLGKQSSMFILYKGR